MAELYRAQGRYEEAEPLYLEALAMRKKLLGEEHPYVATSINNLAGLYHKQGRYSEAEPLYQQALAIADRALGAEHPTTRTIGENYQELQEEKWDIEEEEDWEGEEESMNPEDELGIEELIEKLKRASDEPDLFS